jgi:hypothetical protein
MLYPSLVIPKEHYILEAAPTQLRLLQKAQSNYRSPNLLMQGLMIEVRLLRSSHLMMKIEPVSKILYCPEYQTMNKVQKHNNKYHISLSEPLTIEVSGSYLSRAQFMVLIS